MTDKTSIFAACLMLALLIALGVSAWSPGRALSPEAREPAESATSGATAIVGATVFDGEAFREKVAVVFSGAEIVALVSEDEVPESAEIVEARGQTLLPGLIDSHVHAYGAALDDSLLFGVTTVIDMFSEHGQAARWLREQLAGDVTARADVHSAGTLATAAGGHGTQFGLPIPTLSGPGEAEQFVEDRIEEGSRFLKIILEDGSLYGRTLGTLDEPTAAALVRAAHARDLLAVAHVSTLDMARVALNAGADGLVHLFYDRPVEASWVAEAAEAGLFVIPTLTVLESATGIAGGRSLVSDPRLSAYLGTPAVNGLKGSFPQSVGPPFETAVKNLGALREAGVAILAGTDAPNPGTWFGASMHRELELLVEAGLSPSEALRAATAAPADAFALSDRGRLAPGKLADMVLVDGDPRDDVTATRAISAIWRRGRLVDRRPAPQSVPESRDALAAGVVADFESPHGWQPSTDDMMGGSSTVEMEISTGGARGSASALVVRGEIAPGFPFPWAGAMYFPGAMPMAPVDASGLRALRFRVKGDGQQHRVMFFAESLGRMPAQAVFVAPAEWTEIEVPLDTIRGLDPSGLQAVLFSGPAQVGTFEFTLDDVEFR